MDQDLLVVGLLLQEMVVPVVVQMVILVSMAQVPVFLYQEEEVLNHLVGHLEDQEEHMVRMVLHFKEV